MGRVRPVPSVSIQLSPRHSIQGMLPTPHNKSRRSSLVVTLDRGAPGSAMAGGTEGLTAIEQVLDLRT